MKSNNTKKDKAGVAIKQKNISIEKAFIAGVKYAIQESRPKIKELEEKLKEATSELGFLRSKQLRQEQTINTAKEYIPQLEEKLKSYEDEKNQADIEIKKMKDVLRLLLTHGHYPNITQVCLRIDEIKTKYNI